MNNGAAVLTPPAVITQYAVRRQAPTRPPNLSTGTKKIPMKLSWKKYTYETLDFALKQNYCLYAFHNPQDGDRPFYIGKAKFFGSKQADGYKSSARYNSGYTHLISGMLRSGFDLYIARVGEEKFSEIECYEQELIAQWNPIRQQRIKPIRKPVVTEKPWALARRVDNDAALSTDANRG